jgi:hypothetical protein
MLRKQTLNSVRQTFKTPQQVRQCSATATVSGGAITSAEVCFFEINQDQF